MENKDTLQDARKALRKADLPRFVLKCEEAGVEDDIVDAIKDVIVNGKPIERLQASELYLKYKYGPPPTKTDITSGGEKIPWVINTNLDL